MSATAMSQEQIRLTVLVALMKALGPAGMIRFLQPSETGHGDYSKDRHLWLNSLDIDAALVKLRERQRRGFKQDKGPM